MKIKLNTRTLLEVDGAEMYSPWRKNKYAPKKIVFRQSFSKGPCKKICDECKAFPAPKIMQVAP